MLKEKIIKGITKELTQESNPESLDKWLSSFSIKSVDDKKLVIETPNRFTTDWIRQNYLDQINRAVSAVTGQCLKVVFEENAAAETDKPDADPPKSKAPSAEVSPHPSLEQRYDFNNFVVGPSNQFAHAACRAVSEKKTRNYNPLFIYGGVGLGKTHLLHAIGNHVHQKHPKAKIICIQAETFMNEMIQAIRGEKMDQFRTRYRKDCEVLLMDDIEILAGKERTQEEFFYTFNDLYSAGKKIVITSDKFPKEMTTLEDRLRSRFESGIIVDIQPPEFETRLAILRYQAESEGIKIDDQILMHLAERIKSNIRTLEGALIRLSALSSLSGSPINTSLADDVIRAILDDHEIRLSPETVMKTVASFFKIKVTDLKSPKRNRKYTVPRQLSMYLCRELCSLSYPEIGNAFGGRDHSTVIHSCRKIGLEKNTDFELNRHLETIRRQLTESKF